MFELVITLCLATGCAEEVSPKTADLETCELVGRFMGPLVQMEAARQGFDGTVTWACRKRGVAL